MKTFKNYNIVHNMTKERYEIMILEEIDDRLFKELSTIRYMNKNLLKYLCGELQIDYNSIITENIEYDANDILLFNSNDCKEILDCISIIEQYMVLQKLNQ